MAGCFQDGSVAGKLQFGPAWWFNDHKDGNLEQMRLLANHGALGTFVGMVTDSRSFAAFPRHDYFRRLLCRLLGQWVEDGEYPADPHALETLVRGVSYENAKDLLRFLSQVDRRPGAGSRVTGSGAVSSSGACMSALAIRLHPADTVVVALTALTPGLPVDGGVVARTNVPAGHKIATTAIAKGDAGHQVQPGHRFCHGRHCRRRSRSYRRTWGWAISAATTPSAPMRIPPRLPSPERTFEGIVRADGRVATRNYVGILTS